ncbi:MAG: very short patch repair endonuclease [Sphaerochaetaceae bacterium]|jgi:DNA mismatch endonuclease (patch repair protein)
MDTLTPSKRSEVMSHIRGKNTSCELMVRRYLFSQGFRFRIHDRRYPGHPDIVLPKYRTMVFVNGCFWHGHMDCSLYRQPKSNVAFWKEKIERNRSRDEQNRLLLEQSGWRVIVVWECELRQKHLRENTLPGLVNEIWEWG